MSVCRISVYDVDMCENALFFFSSRRRHTRCSRDWSSDVCSSDLFAPDPGLVGQIRDIRIVTAYARACPGSTIPTTYEAVLADGSRVPFSRTYDKKHPPRLHVIFLDRESPDAVSQGDGDWVGERGPLVPVTTGYRLTATL